MAKKIQCQGCLEMEPQDQITTLGVQDGTGGDIFFFSLCRCCVKCITAVKLLAMIRFAVEMEDPNK